MKKLLASILALSMILAMTACSGGSSSSAGESSSAPAAPASSGESSEEPKELDKVTFVYMTQNNVPETVDLQRVQGLINDHIRDKIQAEVELVLFTNADYSTQLNLRLASNEPADLFRSMNGNPTISYINDGIAMDITDYLDSELKDAVGVLYDGLLATSTVNGRTYGLNVVTSNYVPRGWCYRTDIVEKLQIDLSNVKTIFDLTDVFAKVKESYPDMVLCDPTRAYVAFQAYLQDTEHMDPLGGDSSNAFSGVVFGEDSKVVNAYESDQFKTIANLMRDWYKAGYFPSDAATSTATTAEMASAGNLFSMFAGLGNPKIASVFTSNYNYSYDCIQISDAYSLSTSYDVWMINSGSKAPAAAARFLNLLYTDADLHNFITYGEKGVDYELNEDGFVVPPEGYESLADVPYTNNLNYPYWGSKWLPYRTLGGLTDEEAEVNKKQNYDALLSSFYGFVYDYSNVEAEYLAISNIAEEYKKALWVGSLDVDSALQEMNNKMNASGLDKVIADKQAQLDEWLAHR